MRMDLLFEKDGLVESMLVDFSKLLSLAKNARAIGQYFREDWKLKDLRCDKDKEIEDYFQTLIMEYEADPEHFSYSMWTVVRMGWKIAKGEVKEWTKAEKEGTHE